ncbi:MAG: hypothetical protein K0M64_11120 [Rhizobium sp.]|nr:hypothetical protein [Rhizobium sp.]
MRNGLLLFAILLLPNSAARSQEVEREVWISNGFLTGQEYLALDQSARTTFAMGAVDGMLVAPLLGAADIEWLNACVVGMTGSQVEAMVTKEVRDHPASWNSGVLTAIFRAFNTGCPGSPANSVRQI